ncbi:MAG: DUF523 domain-containing protein [Nanoarchaeota archaeon]|nr:DUF523 domain-containing protein [Nanoarchaeota archaeon]MBU4123856.1 DUF523 domain-containing protein [Nanoarchaeota archaeon]
MERSKRIVFVSHCLLNQNVRAFSTEKYPGMIKELMDIFAESGVGIVQLPCPQIEMNGGLDRKLKQKSAYDNKQYRKYCTNLSSDILKSIEKYLQKNYKVLGIIGVEMSSTCGVHQIENGTKHSPGKGILMEELEELMHKKNFQVPIIGVNLNNMYNSLEKIQSLLKYA